MKSHLNLLPTQFQCKQLLAHRLRLWSVVLLGAVLVCGSFAWIHWTSCHGFSQRREQLESRYEPVAQTQHDIVALRAELLRLEKKRALVLELSEKRPLLVLLGCLSQSASQSGGAVYLESVRVAPSSPPNAADRPEDDMSPTRVMTLEGVAHHNLAVARFTALLRDTGLFTHVELSSIGNAQRGENEFRRFAAQCFF